jgi:polyhydroxybutyrate depolymerase
MKFSRHLHAVIAALVLPCGACSSNSSGISTGTGGAAGLGTGGTLGTSAIGTGGATGLGGQPGSGGTSATGGKPGSGGMSVAGGGPGSGGMSATGGAAGRDAGRDGPSGSGGAGTGGGMGTGGGAGGVAVDGGTTSTGGGGGASAGCGSATTTSPCSKSGTKCSLDVGGTTRTYYVQLPSGYTSSTQYPVVFQFHPMGGTAEMALTEYNLQGAGFSTAIFVTPQGLVSASPGSDAGSPGWANTNGVDIAFTKAMLADVQANYCVDNARIFSTGFSYGGMMSFAIGCEMGDVFRAIAPMSGALYSDFNCKGTGHAVAMWGSHGLSDNVVPIADGRSARDKILQENHCGTQTTPIDPSPCVSYQGCDTGYPVTWCEFAGTHQPPSFGSSSIAAFFKQF